MYVLGGNLFLPQYLKVEHPIFFSIIEIHFLLFVHVCTPFFYIVEFLFFCMYMYVM